MFKAAITGVVEKNHYQHDFGLLHDSGYRCFKHFYLEKVCKHLRHLFPNVVSYNRLVELEREVAVPEGAAGTPPFWKFSYLVT